jgi:hypothetical protein
MMSRKDRRTETLELGRQRRYKVNYPAPIYQNSLYSLIQNLKPRTGRPGATGGRLRHGLSDAPLAGRGFLIPLRRQFGWPQTPPWYNAIYAIWDVEGRLLTDRHGRVVKAYHEEKYVRRTER